MSMFLLIIFTFLCCLQLRVIIIYNFMLRISIFTLKAPSELSYPKDSNCMVQDIIILRSVVITAVEIDE